MTTLASRIELHVLGKKAYRAFFSPGRYQFRPADLVILESGNNYRLPFEGGELSVTTWGDRGPKVLLMHGWGGARAQMTGFVRPLLEAGYQVVSYDQPAHGESDGTLTNILEITPTMELVTNREGNFEAIIAHSFGTLVVSYALAYRNFPAPSRLVYLGAFNRLMDSLPRFQALSGLPDDVVGELRNMIYENFGKDVLDAIDNETMIRKIDISALMFHDTTDRVTPIEDSRAIASAWKSARLIETTALDHRGALQSPLVFEQVLKFLKD